MEAMPGSLTKTVVHLSILTEILFMF